MEHTNEVYKDIDPPSVWLSALVLAVFMIFAALVVHSGTCLADATETNYSPVRSNQFFSESKVEPDLKLKCNTD
ncbi:DoxX family protein [Schleiferilactobacillus harbinensis]|uniref:DoxX family protein n=1 Tax=Schleiferilactobacillus harbinensis TaxID=304207 RepID=UPI00123B8755|nr:DoxX family protein [Schleiferilactobacillus harbinensis]QEU47750.1 DoxX family protein [Schleiferilactobacillus harbinensis]